MVLECDCVAWVEVQIHLVKFSPIKVQVSQERFCILEMYVVFAVETWKNLSGQNKNHKICLNKL